MTNKNMDTLDTNEICIILSKAHSTVRNMLRNEKFKTAFKKGSLNRWYVKTEEIISYLKENNNILITKKEIKNKLNKFNSINFDENTEFITVKEAKKELSLCSNSIYRKIKAGKLKAKKVRNGKIVPRNSHNGKYMISKDSILEFNREPENTI